MTDKLAQKKRKCISLETKIGIIKKHCDQIITSTTLSKEFGKDFSNVVENILKFPQKLTNTLYIKIPYMILNTPNFFFQNLRNTLLIFEDVLEDFRVCRLIRLLIKCNGVTFMIFFNKISNK
ncbi:hypothetical protein BpHYR1_019268 [Brachionus plicatilis]|uniref:Uncharacterized protein n=1 Tax=Brachionus plicatilis TaxID=10195 RepID=A0A3M7PE97_BRAPC|nr:hypothetical protein BpHYR1_019268 [Brachionus plicatilis]